MPSPDIDATTSEQPLLTASCCRQAWSGSTILEIEVHKRSLEMNGGAGPTCCFGRLVPRLSPTPGCSSDIAICRRGGDPHLGRCGSAINQRNQATPGLHTA